MKAYWWLRHAIWDLRDEITVRLIDRALGGNNTLYVHRTGSGPAFAVVRRVDTEGHQAEWEPHSHVEGFDR